MGEKGQHQKQLDIWEYAQIEAQKSKWERFRTFVYDSEHGSCLGRTPLRWVQLIVFFCCFYAGIAALFTICLHVLYSTIDERIPKYTLTSSLIGDNPGVAYRPLSADFETASVIWFKSSNTKNVMTWTDNLDDFLDVYINPSKAKGGGRNRQSCDYNKPLLPGNVCNVDVNSTQWGPCRAENKYGYLNSTPCLFIKLNKIYGWIPQTYNDIESLPSDMPSDLVNYIKSIEPEQRSAIWVSCHGESPVDVEAIGPITYYPQPGFPGYFYPYLNPDGYLSPIVAVHFAQPTLNQVIVIECRVWAKNINYRKSALQREGSIRIELQVDS